RRGGGDHFGIPLRLLGVPVGGLVLEEAADLLLGRRGGLQGGPRHQVNVGAVTAAAVPLARPADGRVIDERGGLAQRELGGLGFVGLVRRHGGFLGGSSRGGEQADQGQGSKAEVHHGSPGG